MTDSERVAALLKKIADALNKLPEPVSAYHGGKEAGGFIVVTQGLGEVYEFTIRAEDVGVRKRHDLGDVKEGGA